MKFLITVLLSLSFIWANAQNKIILHTEAVEAMLSWMNNSCPSSEIKNLAQYPANQLMEQMLKKKNSNVADFEKSLSEFNVHDTVANEYMLDKAYISKDGIADLLHEIKNSDFLDVVYNKALIYFPENYLPLRDYEMFFDVTGWEWGDAMSFDYIKEGEKYIVSSEGTPAIIINLTKVCQNYGSNAKEQLDNLSNVIAHEMFHAILSDFIPNNWKSWNDEDINENAFYLMLNEGIAHYISIKEYINSSYNDGDFLKQTEKSAFTSLCDSAKIIFNANLTDEIRINALTSGCYGQFWNKYICMTGLFMIYHIENIEGLEGVRECVVNGPEYFVRKYDNLMLNDNELPKLPNEIISIIDK